MRKWILALMLSVPGWGGERVVLPRYEANVEKISPSSEDWAGLWEGCSLGCALGWKTTASSHLRPQGKHSYEPSRAEDGKIATAWIEGARGNGEGEWLECRFDRQGPRSVGFSGATFVIGYARTPKSFLDNSRPRQMLMQVDGKPVAYLNFKDSRDPQSFSFDRLQVHPGGSVRFVLTQVYPGRKYADTAITEMNLYGGH